MRMLVTGAAGFIGMHTSLRLLERGFQVIGFDDLNADSVHQRDLRLASRPWTAGRSTERDRRVSVSSTVGVSIATSRYIVERWGVPKQPGPRPAAHGRVRPVAVNLVASRSGAFVTP